MFSAGIHVYFYSYFYFIVVKNEEKVFASVLVLVRVSEWRHSVCFYADTLYIMVCDMDRLCACYGQS